MKLFADLVSMRLAPSIISLLAFVWASAQEIPVGSWRTHFSYQQARLLAASSTHLFCATESGLFSLDFDTGESRKLSKLDGLGDIGVSAMVYSAEQNILVLGYTSGVIDLVFPEKIKSLTRIARSDLNREKRINDIALSRNKAYIASDFGVVVVDFDQEEVVENFLAIGQGGTDVVAEEVLVRNDSLFVITGEGIQTGALSENLLDFNNWTHFAATDGFSTLVSTSASLFALDGTQIVRYREGLWQPTGITLPAGGTGLFEAEDKIFTTVEGNIYELGGSTFGLALQSAGSEINDFIIEDGRFFIADEGAGLLDSEGNLLSPDGPIADSFSRIRVSDGTLYALNAPHASTYIGEEQLPLFSVFEEGRWSTASIEHFTNVSDVAVYNGTRYYTSIGDGLYIEGQGIVKDIPNSPSGADTMLTSLQTGAVLHVAGYGGDPLHALDSDEWQSYSASQVLNSQFEKLASSQLGVLWLLASNGTISLFDPEDLQADVLSVADGLPALVEDLYVSVEDNAWIATSQGPARFPSASFIFSDTQAELPVFEGRVLFESEPIHTLITDGGNRIWFGTNQGVWVFDENTSRLEAVFNAENSPLPSDDIAHLAYNPQNGEVFMATERGMVSYRSASSRGTATHTGVSIFPNPVRPDYEGRVGITGLANNATLKIVDVNGYLVQEIQANGGTASWDLRGADGGAVSTGVYFFLSATQDGAETFVGKIAVVR